MFAWLNKLFSRNAPQRRVMMRQRDRTASYDAAQTTDNSSRHWAYADSLGARSANDPLTRQELRNRSRYEIANNCYARGMTLTLANNFAGWTGPRLQIKTDDQAANTQTESAFATWVNASAFVDKLLTAKLAKTGDGEAFGILTTNPMLRHSVKLDVKLVECDQCTTPGLMLYDRNKVDGIVFDDYGNPVEYHFLHDHPGDFAARWGQKKVVAARNVVHWFRKDRPGQVRGIPEITPALPLFAQLRRFTLATLTAAETAAMFAAVLKTNLPANTDELEDPFSTLDIERGMMTVLPADNEIQQFAAEHPGTTHEMFVWVLIREICRCLNLPLNIALGDSSKSNFSSARLDHLVYRQSVAVERRDCEREFLEPVFAAWLDEATRIPGLLPPNLPADPMSLPHVWHWPAWEPIDPITEAKADTERLTNGSTTLAEVCGRLGTDWRAVITQRSEEEAFENAERQRLGLGPKVQPNQPAQPTDATNAA